MAFKYHDNNQHHESLDDWMKRNIFMKKSNQFINDHVHVTMVGKPED